MRLRYIQDQGAKNFTQRPCYPWSRPELADPLTINDFSISNHRLFTPLSFSFSTLRHSDFVRFTFLQSTAINYRNQSSRLFYVQRQKWRNKHSMSTCSPHHSSSPRACTVISTQPSNLLIQLCPPKERSLSSLVPVVV